MFTKNIFILVFYNLTGSSVPDGYSESEAKKHVYPMWNDLRTYLISTIEPKEITALLSTISLFKKKEELK